MLKNSPNIPLSIFMFATVTAHLAYFVPTIAAFLIFDLTDIRVALFLILFHSIAAIPIGAALAWLVGKGSNWVNAPAGMFVICVMPATFYGLILGALLGFRLFGTLGGSVATILSLVIALTIRFPLAKWITERFLPSVQLAKP